MLKPSDVKKVAQSRLQDAEALYTANRYDGAAYLCGYAVELALKARICRTLQWPGFPESGSEFQGLTSFRIHDLEMLLRLSGRIKMVKSKYLTEWSAVAAWTPEERYRLAGALPKADARQMLDAANVLLGKI